MKVADLRPAQVTRALCDEGLFVYVGPFVLRLRSNAPEIPAHVRDIYSFHEVAEHDCAESSVAVQIIREKWRPWRQQAHLKIDGRPFMTPLQPRLAIPMLEWGMNWVVAVRAHNYLLVHAAVVEKAGRVVLLPATSGSGKSTLCALLVHAGWRLFSDEFAVIRLSDGLFLPMPRGVSLKNQSITLVRGLFPDAKFTADFAHTVKGTLAFMGAPEDSVARSHIPAPLGMIVFPKYDPAVTLQTIEMSRTQAHAGLVANSMNYGALGESGFMRTADLIESAPAWRLVYHDIESALDWFDRAADRFA